MSALSEAQAARVELRASSYWKPNTKGWATTRLAKCDTHLGNVIAALSVPIPVPMPSPQPSGLIDDMRATHMSAISSRIISVPGAVDTVVDHNGVRLGNGWTISQSQSPVGFWDDLLFTGNDVTITTDPHYGNVYRFHADGDSHNPYWNTPTVGNASLVKNRTVTIGQFDWYGLTVKWEPGWDWKKIDWSVVLQCAYPTISSPPLGIFAGYGDNIYVQRWAGPVVDGPAQASIWNVRKQSEVAGHWLEIVLGAKWGSNNDGEIHYLDRCKDLGETTFTERVAATGITTWQWGGAAPKNPSNYSVVDKLDCYRGYLAPVTDDTVPANYVQHTGYVRCTDKASALAYMEGK